LHAYNVSRALFLQNVVALSQAGASYEKNLEWISCEPTDAISRDARLKITRDDFVDVVERKKGSGLVFHARVASVGESGEKNKNKNKK